MDLEETALINNEENRKFEMIIDGYRSFMEYKMKGEALQLTYIEVPKELEGKGVAALLVIKTFQYLEEVGLGVIPACTYVQNFLKDHPEWNHLVAK